MQPPAKKILLTVIKLAIPAAIIFWLLWRMEPEEWEQLREQPKNYPLLVSALLVALSGMVLSFVRWWLLVRCQGIGLSVVEALRLSSIGFLLSFASAGSVGGDLFKAIFLAKRSPGKRIEAIASVVVDRGVGLLGLLLMVTIALAFVDPQPSGGGEDSREVERIGAAAMYFSTIGFAVLGVLILGGRSIDRFVDWAATWPLIGELVGRVAGPLRMFHRYPVAFGVSLVMSVGVHVLLTLAIYMIARALFADPPTLADHLVIVPLANTAAALPIAPAGLGLMEAAMEWLYHVIPATPTKASGTLVALVYDFVKILLAVAGMVFYWSAGREVKSSLEEVDAPENVELSSV